MNIPPTNQTRYSTTRHAWERIWQDASMAQEMQAIAYPRAQATLRAYLPYLSRDEVILEAGSGLGAVVLTLRQMGYQTIGLDYAANALQVVHEYAPDLPQVAADVHALPYAANSLGAYLSFGVLEHFEHGMLPALREAYRVLKPGGVLVLTIPYPNIVWRLAQARRRLAGKRLIDETFYESTYDRAALIQQVAQAGFIVLDTQPTSHAFTLWGLAGIFRTPGYYRTSPLADWLGGWLCRLLPWTFNFMTLAVARKP